MEQELTPFQSDLEGDLERSGFRILDRQVEGQSEYFISGRLATPECRIWIYSDGAEVLTAAEVRRIFEAADFDTLDDLRGAFLSVLDGWRRSDNQ